LIDVKTDRNAVGMPPHTTLKQLSSYALSEAKMVLDGRSGEVLDHVRSNLKYIRDL
jgi:pyruvate dehydrogenase (quinone)